MDESATVREALCDRRDAIRQGTPAIPVLVQDGEGGEHDASIVDVSRRGIRIGMHDALPRGSEVLVRAASTIGVGDLRPIRARVVRETLLSEGSDHRVVYGLRFTEAADVRRHRWWLTLREAA